MVEPLAEFLDLCARLAVELLHPLGELRQRAAELLRRSGAGSNFADRPAQFDQLVVSLGVVDRVETRGEGVHRSCKRFGFARMFGKETGLASMIARDQNASAHAEGRKRDRPCQSQPRSCEAL